MPRKLRVEYPGAMYHVMSRGDRREDIFLNDVDRQDFIKALAEACQKTAWQVHAYCLMRNHYHLVLETPNANLVAGMAWLQSTYTIRLNHRHKLFGHIFSGRRRKRRRNGSWAKTWAGWVGRRLIWIRGARASRPNSPSRCASGERRRYRPKPSPVASI